jgi:transcriptional regulator with XRE-family HTH domain
LLQLPKSADFYRKSDGFMEVYEKIRFLRESKNWSQEEMAEKLNMSLSGYTKVERGDTKISIPKLKKIAEVLETDLLELMCLGEKYVYFSGNDNSNNGYNIIGSPELAFEIQKQQLQLEMKDKELAMQQREIALKDKQISQLEELLEMHKREKS